jgi:uncharacterized protein (DUF4415 family)
MPRKDNPEWTKEDFAKATRFKRGVSLEEATKVMVAKRGRPKLLRPKVLLTLRIDPDVLDAYKETGEGWQARMNEALAKAAKRIKAA